MEKIIQGTATTAEGSFVVVGVVVVVVVLPITYIFRFVS
jgi:hypothetical protein